MSIQQYIGYNNAGTIGNVVADSEQANYPATNLANPATNLLWKSDSTSAQYVTIDIDAEQSCDYIGIARHNLGTAQCDIEIQGQTVDGGAWSTIVPDFGPSSWNFNHSEYTTHKATTEQTSNKSTRHGDFWKLVDNAVSGLHGLSRSYSGAATRTVSLVVKAGTLTKCRLKFYNPTDGSREVTKFDLSSGNVLSGSGNIQNLGNGEYLISITATSTVDDEIHINCINANGDVSYTGTGTDFFYMADLQVDIGSSIKGYAPLTSDNKPILKTFTSGDYYGVRIKITPGGSIRPQMAVVYTGEIMQMQRNIYVGHTPIPYARSINAVNRLSESGQFLGRIIKGTTYKSQVKIQHMTKDWYRSTFDTFVKVSKTKPFFYAWRLTDYATEIGYCWVIGGVPVPDNTGPNGMMSVSFNISGLA